MVHLLHVLMDTGASRSHRRVSFTATSCELSILRPRQPEELAEAGLGAPSPRIKHALVLPLMHTQNRHPYTKPGNSHFVAGGVALYIVGILYMFVGIGIVCDDFFVASLEAISEALHLSEDVAG